MEIVEFQTTIKPEVLEKEVVVSSQEDYTYFGDVLKLCKLKVKEIDEERKTYTAPLDESKKRIMAKANAIIKPIEEYMEKINKAMGAWYLIEEKKRAEEQRRLEEEAIKNAPKEATDVAVPVVESIKTTQGNVGKNTAIKYFDFEVVNVNEVPREYLTLDESKVKDAINKGGVKEIKGLKIVEKVRFSSR